ncbi:MAG: MFS transporter [Thermoanaerobacterium sp.]|nr:MFS transporter [Thermoanaerobacterium sp.]
MEKGDKLTSWWRYRYLVAAVLFFAYSIQYLDRIKTTALIPMIMKSINLSHDAVGNGIFLMMIFYGPSQFVSGILCDKYGAKKVLIFSLISWSLLTFWMAFMYSSSEWYIRNALFGILVGTEFVPSARILSRWFPSCQRAQAQSSLSWAWILTPAWASILATQLAAYFGDFHVSGHGNFTSIINCLAY